jgi:hypothetical protein
MALRQAYSPIHPEFDDFLFATVGEEINGMPLSTISMLTRLGLDPWSEAGRLASLAKREATDQLALIIARLPGTDWVDARRAEIASKLIELLPKRAKTETTAGSQLPRYRRAGYWAITIGRGRPWLIALIFTAAVVVTVVVQHFWPFGGR